MKCLLVSGGSLDIELLKKIWSEMDNPYVIGVDRGTLKLFEAGIPVDISVGDYDSVSDEEREIILGRCKVERLVPEKDDTDTEHAIRMAIELKPESIVMLGCTGTRLDQTIASIRLLKIAKDTGVPAVLQDTTNRIRVEKGEITLRKDEIFGKFISVMPYGDEMRGLTIRGLKYEVENFDMTAEYSRGVSNELLQEYGTIACDDYYILMETID